MHNDDELLREYAATGAQEPFRIIVTRYFDMVYSTALRRTQGDPHQAADVCQRVFCALATNAWKVARKPVAGPWLFVAARNAAANLMTAERRRREREFRAGVLLEPTPEQTIDWNRVRPYLDEAIDDLSEKERSVVVLRFLECRSYPEIARVLKLSEGAARMRVDRALEKLRRSFGRRGIASTSTMLTGALLGQPPVAAPTGLAESVATQALLAAPQSCSFALTTSFMTMKKVTAAVGALIALLAGVFVAMNFGPTRSSDRGIAGGSRASEPSPQLPQPAADGAKRSLVPVATHVPAKSESDRIAKAETALPIGTVQQRILNNLRRIEAAARYFKIQQGRAPYSIDELIGPGRLIPSLDAVAGESYSSVGLSGEYPMTVATPGGILTTYDPKGIVTTRPMRDDANLDPTLQAKGAVLAPAVAQAMRAFRAAHPNAGTPTAKELLPYFETAQQGADYVEWMEEYVAAKKRL